MSSNNINNLTPESHRKTSSQNNLQDILMNRQDISQNEWILDGIRGNQQGTTMSGQNNNVSPLKCPSQYSLIDQTLIQQSNHKPTLISQGLFAFEEEEDRSNSGFLNDQYAYNYKEGIDEFDQEEFDEEDDGDEEDDDEIFQLHQNQDENNNNGDKNSDKTNQKQFACEYEECGKLFKAKKSLRDHLRIHTNQRPYSCSEPYCGKSFVQYSSLQKHLRTHKGDRPYKCDFDDCDQAFTQVSNLKRHQKIHLNDKPFVCSVCFRKFTTSSNLKQHTITHGSQGMRQRFKCVIDECGKSYLYSSSLKKHEKEHILSTKTNPVGQVSTSLIVNELCGLHGNNLNPQIQQQQMQQQLPQGEGEFKLQNTVEDENNNKFNVVNHNNERDSEANDSFAHRQEHQSQPQQVTVSNSTSIHGTRVNMEDMDMLGQFFNSHHVALQHDGHYDVLFKGYLYHYNRKSGKIEIHDIQAHDEITKGTCQPLSEKSHNSNEEIHLKLNEIEHRFRDQAAESHTCSAITCKCDEENLKIQQGISQINSCCGDVSKSECACAPIQPAEGGNQNDVLQVVCCSEPNCTKEIVQAAPRNQCHTVENDRNEDQIRNGSMAAGQETEVSDKDNCDNINKNQSENTDKNILEEKAQEQENIQGEPVKSEDCCCTIDNVKMECTCNGCEGDCPTCSRSEKCIFKNHHNQLNQEHYQDSNNNILHGQQHNHEHQQADYIQYQHQDHQEHNHSHQQQQQPKQQQQQNEIQHQPQWDWQQVDNNQHQQSLLWQSPQENIEQTYTSKCICLETKDMKHLHGPNCGHVPIYHHGHLDYIVENQLHHPHGTHCDFHGTVSVLDNIAKI